MHFKCNKMSFLSTRKMNQMIIAQFYCFVFILLQAFGLSTSSNLIFGLPTRHVRIVNHLNNKILTYHCKSGDDDLGVRTLKPNGEWEFSFRPTFYAVTEFYCYFFYENFHTAFDVYKDDGKLNVQCGGVHCIWTAQDDGFYLYNLKKNQNVKMHDWTK